MKGDPFVVGPRKRKRSAQRRKILLYDNLKYYFTGFTCLSCYACLLNYLFNDFVAVKLITTTLDREILANQNA